MTIIAGLQSGENINSLSESEYTIYYKGEGNGSAQWEFAEKHIAAAINHLPEGKVSRLLLKVEKE